MIDELIKNKAFHYLQNMRDGIDYLEELLRAETYGDKEERKEVLVETLEDGKELFSLFLDEPTEADYRRMKEDRAYDHRQYEKEVYGI